MERSRTEDLVGREADLDALLRPAVDADPGAVGRVGMVLLSGDAGVGKTRLLTEALDRLRAQGWRALVGHCLDFGETSMPYLPFAEMLDEVDRWAGGEESSDPEELGRRHPALAGLRHRAASGQAADAGGLERAEVFEAVAGLVEDLASEAPLALVVEDAHWADASTRDLVSFLLARRGRGRVLLVVTFRSDEMHRRHPLRGRVAEWVRLPGVERVQLDPLPASAVRRLVQDLLGSTEARHDDDVERIVQRAQGNAFYVEELVGAFLGGGGSLPEDLADLLLVRLERLQGPARDVVRVASAAGQRVAHELLARVAPVGPDVLDEALREAIDAHVLVRSGDSEYAFRHALLGEAVYDDLLPGERMRLHTSYAAAVRELDGPRGAAELARHALASHDLPTALQASVDAGEQALATGGPDEAARHFTRALEIFDRAAPQLDVPPDETELVARTVDALSSSGRPETALALVDSHLARLPPDAPALARARLLLARIEALRSVEAEDRPSDISSEVVRLVGPGRTELRARGLAVHAQCLVWDDDFGGARAAADEALEIAEELDLPRLAADVVTTLTLLGQHDDLGETSRAELRRVIEDARVRGDLPSRLRGLLRLASLDHDYGALEAAQEGYLATSRLARETGRPWSVYGIAGRMRAGIAAYMRGDWDLVLQLADVRDEDPPPIPRAMLACLPLAVAAGRGEVAALVGYPALRERWRPEGLIAVTGGAAALELVALRDGALAAVATYDDVCRVLAPLWGEHFDARLRLATLAVAALADEAPRTPSGSRAALRDPADRVVAEAGAVLDARERTGRPFALEGRAWEARLVAERLRLAWLLGDPVDLVDLVDLAARWREAVDRFAELGHRYEEARCRTRLAVVLRASGEPAAAQEQAAPARALATRLGARVLVEELGDLGRASAEAGRLTPREREILALVATGRSNAAIGQQLFISAKTVSVHVSNLMAKLGASSRTEAVAVARGEGLIG